MSTEIEAVSALSLRHLFDQDRPTARLLRHVLSFCWVESLYSGFSLAFAFSVYGLRGALGFLAGLAVVSVIGVFIAFSLMQGSEHRPWRVLQGGIALFSLGMFSVSFMTSPLWSLVVLVLAGIPRGACWASKQWMELSHTKGVARESYFSIFQSGVTLFKLLGPVLAGWILFITLNNFHLLFAVIGAAGLLASGLIQRMQPILTRRPGPSRPWRALESANFWNTAPFFLFEGAGATLRVLLFVTGALTVLNSVSVYGVLDAVVSFIAAGTLIWLARLRRKAPSLLQLRISLALVAAAWMLLIGALHFKMLFGVFVLLYAIGNPLLSAVNMSLVIKGLAIEGEAHDNALAREVLIFISRLAAQGLALALTFIWPSPEHMLQSVIALLLIFTPFEYYFAKRIARHGAAA